MVAVCLWACGAGMLLWAREVEVDGSGEGEEVAVGMDMFLGETFGLGWRSEVFWFVKSRICHWRRRFAYQDTPC